MQLSRNAQVHLSTICILVTIGIYAFIHARPAFHGPLRQEHKLETEGWNASFELREVLHPEAHVHRAPKQIHLVFNITAGDRQPDGVKKHVYLINGQFPGPTIEARSGDELVIKVYNSLLDGEGTAIHWHGLSMRGEPFFSETDQHLNPITLVKIIRRKNSMLIICLDANDMDGTVGVTQHAIAASENFVYRFKIEENQAGTFWYHAHSEVQRADGLYGGIVVHKPVNGNDTEMTNNNYDEELLFLIGDWYHRPARKVLAYYMDWRNFGAEPSPDSLLINGLGAFNCSMAVPARPLECTHVAPPQLKINGRRSRLRIVNTGALTGVTLSMAGYEMVLYQIDGGNTVESLPAAQSMGILYPGERMDVLVQRINNGDDITPSLTIALDPENMRFPNLALTRVQSFDIIPLLARDKNSDRPLPSTLFYDLAKVAGSATSDIPQNASQIFLFYTKIEILSEFRNIPKGFINRTSWSPENASSAPLLSVDRTEWATDLFVPRVKSGADEWVDIVLNNLDDKSHPFHLHGHDFFVLSTHKSSLGRYEAYNPFDSTKPPAGGPMNLQNPPKKDTVLVPRMGYVVLRFAADNAGLWFFHCHVLWHQAVGMAMAFQIGEQTPSV